jgi:SET domain-containing protein
MLSLKQDNRSHLNDTSVKCTKFILRGTSASLLPLKHSEHYDISHLRKEARVMGRQSNTCRVVYVRQKCYGVRLEPTRGWRKLT